MRGSNHRNTRSLELNSNASTTRSSLHIKSLFLVCQGYLTTRCLEELHIYYLLKNFGFTRLNTELPIGTHEQQPVRLGYKVKSFTKQLSCCMTSVLTAKNKKPAVEKLVFYGRQTDQKNLSGEGFEPSQH